MTAALRRWWRNEPKPKPDERFVEDVRRIRAEMLPRQRELRRELAGRGECPLVRDVFDPHRHRRREER